MRSRRSFVFQPAARAGADQPGEAKASASLKPIKSADFGYDEARHLLWRAGWGGTPQQIQTLVGWGPEESVDYMLHPEKVEFARAKADLFDKDIMRPPSSDERRMYAAARRANDEDSLAKARLDRQMRERDDRRQIGEMQKWWLTRLIETPRPLEEKMTLFWHGHFATSFRTIENSYHMFVQNELFRSQAMGNFGEMLLAIIRDPAMLAYLDNNDSRKGRPNENLAREIMELFALGVGAYTEKDIKEGARALTGYTFSDDEFEFQRGNHDEGQKSILGRSGPFDGDGFVKIILDQRACAAFITRKLYSAFVNWLPPVERLSDDDLDATTRSVLRQLAAGFSENNYEIKPMLRRMLLSEHFYDSRFRAEQIKSPAQLVVGAVRSMNTPVRDLSVLNDALDLMGQNLFLPPSVKGWEGGRSWINTSTLFVRQNILAFLLTGKKPIGYDPSASVDKYDPMPLLSELAKADPGADRDPARVVDYLLRLTLGVAPAHARASLNKFVEDNGGQVTPGVVTGLLLLITAMPEYQLC